MVISVVLFFANSAPIIKIVVDKYAPRYNITYKSIEGNLIQDLHISDIRYKNEPLAKSATLSWSPWAILQGQIFLDTLDVQDVAIDVVNKFASEFQSDEQNSSSTERIDLDIAIKKSNITFLPHKLTQDISIDAMKLTIKQSIFSIKELKLIEGDPKINIVTNFGTLAYNAQKDERYMLAGFGKIYPKQALFDRYNIPLQADALKEITIKKFNIDTQRLFISFASEGKGALFQKSYPIDIRNFTSELTYNFDTLSLNVDSKAYLDGADFKNTLLTNSLTLDEKLEFQGELVPEKIVTFGETSERVFEAMQIHYQGDAHTLDANITSKLFTGSFTSKAYKEAHFELYSKAPIPLSSYMKLPKAFQSATADIKLDAPLNLRKFSKSKINAKIRSNIANIDAKIALNDSLSSDAKLKIPQNTLLKNYDSTVNWSLLDNATLQVKRKNKGWDVALQSKALFADLIYSDAALQGKIKIEGKPIANLNIDGAFDLQMSSDKEGKENLQISSKSLKIGDKKIDQKEIKDITLQIVQKGEGSFVIPAYSLSYKDIPIFAKKPSSFDIKGDQYILKELWINDQALTQGSYDATSQKGSFELNADTFHLENKFADLDAKIDLIAKLEGGKTDISGSVDILGGELKYSLEQKTFPSDSDIVIIQDIHYKEPSTFVKNLSTNIKIEAKKPIIYKQKNADIIATGNISINKLENTNPLVTGMMTIPKGSSYQFQGKKFILKESHIYFVGEYNKPLLDISADYKSSAYKITVFVSGTPSAPNITFSSRPKLSQEQILAVLLFGSQDAAGTHSGTEMMKMIGSAIAKSALSDAGIKVDHLVLGADTLEVGKKISDRVTIIYVNEEVSKVKVVYQQSKTVDEVLTVSPNSTAVDIYYKKEFEDMGDIFYRQKD